MVYCDSPRVRATSAAFPICLCSACVRRLACLPSLTRLPGHSNLTETNYCLNTQEIVHASAIGGCISVECWSDDDDARSIWMVLPHELEEVDEDEETKTSGVVSLCRPNASVIFVDMLYT